MTSPEQDAGPDPTLRSAIEALPGERTPPAGSWQHLQAAIAVPSDRAGTSRRARASVWSRVVRVAAPALAALLVLVVSTRMLRNGGQAATDPLRALSAEERRDPRVLAVIEQTRNWRAAAGDSLRSARWPREARRAIDGALASTELALASARATLARNPADADAREAIVVLREKQLLLLQHAMALLDEL